MKVVYFDNWTKGIRCFLPLEKELNESGHETLLIHTESFKSNKTKKEERLNNILTRDISFYKTRLIYKVLKAERPDLVVSLNTTFILDRCLSLACKSLGIKTIYIMHGEHNVEENLESFIEGDKNRDSLRNKLPKAWFYIKNHVFNYLYSYFKTKDKPYSLGYLFKILKSNFSNPSTERYFPKYGKDFLSDYAFIYSEKYRSHYIKLGYTNDNIYVSGYPEYDSIFKRIEENNFDRSQLEISTLIDSKYVVYIDNAYADMNLYGWDKEKRNKVLNEIASNLKPKGLKLIVKVHPSNTLLSDIKSNPDSDFIIIQKANDFELICKFSEYCIVQSSTANNIPLLLGKALVLPVWGEFKDEDNVLPKFLLNKWVKIDEINIDFDHEKRIEYIKQNFGRKNGVSSSAFIVRKVSDLILHKN